MFPRTIFGPEHEAFRDQVRRFVDREISPHGAEWDRAGIVPREVWLKAGAAGLLCASLPEVYGGGGGDRLHSVIVSEELSRVGAFGPGFNLHSDIVATYIENHGDEAQKARFLPGMARGETIGAIAMTEPGAGSDLQGIATRALRDGDDYVLTGQKTFISNGRHADVIVVVAKTEPEQGAKGLSLLVVEGDRPGLSRGRNLEKLGSHAQDTSELFFDAVRVPVANLLGEPGQGFPMMMRELAWERLQIAVMAVALLEGALGWTTDYTKARRAFGKPIFDFQNTRFTLAEAKTQITIARVFVDRCLESMMAGALDPVTAAMAKYWTTDIQSKILDNCLQLHGGYGYMWEQPICRAYADTRIQRIFGGANEIMKELIGRSL